MRAWALGVVAGSLCGCATTRPEPQEARDQPSLTVRIQGRSGSELTGQAAFRPTSDGVLLTMRISGAPPGMHAVHLHQKADCSAPDASSAGDHWNPGGHAHGHLMKPPSHLGDIGNLVVDENGIGTLEFLSDQWSLGTGAQNDVVGTSIVIHEKEDDLMSQPSGNAGGRIGCGVVTMQPSDAVSVRGPWSLGSWR
jgi:superoxide dismutase, Cu-Zn family